MLLQTSLASIFFHHHQSHNCSLFRCVWSQLHHGGLLLWFMDSLVAACRLRCSTACGYQFPIRDQTCVPWAGRQIVIHWTTRNIPEFYLILIDSNLDSHMWRAAATWNTAVVAKLRYGFIQQCLGFIAILLGSTNALTLFLILKLQLLNAFFSN